MAILGRDKYFYQHHTNYRVYQCALEIGTQKRIFTYGDNTWSTVLHRHDDVHLYSPGLAVTCTDVSDYNTLWSLFGTVSDNYEMGISYGDTQN